MAKKNSQENRPRSFVFQKVEEKGFITRDQKTIRNTKGEKGNWIFDLRAVFLDVRALDAIATLFWEEFESKLPFQVGGMEVAAIPLMTAIALKGKERGHDINSFIVRKERKPSGLCKRVEGILTQDPIVIVDDLTNSASSIKKIQTALTEETKQKIRDVFVLISFDRKHTNAWYQKQKIQLHSLYTLEEFLGEKYKEEGPNHPAKSNMEIVWKFEAGNPNHSFIVPKSTPALDENSLYFGTDDGTFFAIQQDTGKAIWTFQCGAHIKGIFSSPALDKDTVYFGAYDGNVYALNKTTGKLKWKYTRADYVGSSPALAPDLGLVFIGLEHSLHGRKGSVVALDTQTGEQKWEYTMGEFLHGSPAYLPSKKVVAIGTNDSVVFLFNAETGRLLWQHRVGGAVKMSLAFDEKRNQVIFGSHDGNCYGLNLDTGKENFCLNTEDVIYSTPLIVGNKLYVTSTDKHLYIWDLEENKPLGKKRDDGRILSSPRLIDKKIYWGTNSGMVYELNPNTDEITDSILLPERITCAITKSKAHNLFYATTTGNQIFSFRKKS